MTMNKNTINIAFVGFGEVNSPKNLLEKKCNYALEEIRSLGFNVISTDLVTDDNDGIDVNRAIKDLSGKEFDALIICIAGWIPSHTVINITEEFKSIPMILWGLAGDKIDNRIVTTAPQAGTSALRIVFKDLGYKFIYIYNIIGKPSPLEKIENFLLAASAAKAIVKSKIGMMGFRDMNLYNTFYEGISLKKKMGIDIEYFEMLEMVQFSKNINSNEVTTILNKIKKEWNFEGSFDDQMLDQGITYYLAIRKIVEENNYNAVSIKDVDGMKKLLGFPPAMIFMLLSDEMNICTIPENDAMGSVTQLIIKYITGQSAAYLEFYEFFENSVLLGVPDYVPAETVDGKVNVIPAGFGSLSKGLLNISKMKTGKITLARLSYSRNSYTMHICEGEGRLISWEEAGWDYPAPQLPSLEVFIDTPVEDFAQNITGQHYIIAYGDYQDSLKNFCYLRDINVV